MDFLDKNYSRNALTFWMKTFLVLHAITTMFLMCWSVIEDSMENYIIPLKSPHVIYLLWTAYTIYVLQRSFKVKYVSSINTILAIWIIFILASILLFVLDALLLGLRFGPTVADCYEDSSQNVTLPSMCDDGDEKYIYTVTGIVSATHLIWTFMLAFLSFFLYQQFTEYIEVERERQYRKKNPNGDYVPGVYSYGNQYASVPYGVNSKATNIGESAIVNGTPDTDIVMDLCDRTPGSYIRKNV